MYRGRQHRFISVSCSKILSSKERDSNLSYVNLIQSEIMQLEGGAFQKLFDEYLYRKYNFKNIQPLGVQTATNKPTKGVPDTYVLSDDGTYILICYGSVASDPADKIKKDILSCFDSGKLSLKKDKIKKIICGHCSTNIHLESFDDLRKSIEGVEVELIGIGTLSHDLAHKYPHIAKSHLGVDIDTYQIFDVEEFVKVYDSNGINAPIGCAFFHREKEIDLINNSIVDNSVTILSGPSGIGKTRLAIEVCRLQDSTEYTVLCVRNNGIFLYDDLRYYIDTPGKYLLFLDDANLVVSLDYVLNTLLSYPKEYTIKVLISVRDYAKEKVIDLAKKYTSPNVIQIEKFSDDEIKDILKRDLGILNYAYLDRIAEIVNGNARLAFLAGMRSIDEGYPSIRSSEDIFRNYYGRIIDDAKLEKKDILLLFFISVAGPVLRDNNQFYNDLKKRYGFDSNEDDIVEKLYSLELIDWFKGEITKVADQSFGNYILYHVLVEKRWITIESFIDIAFPKYKNKAIYALNTLMEIFYSEDLEKNINGAIVEAWNNASSEHEMDYLESFYPAAPDKALCIIKKKIDHEDYMEFDLHGFDINKNKNHHNITTKEIYILGGLKYTKAFDDALDLLMLYYEKRPDLIMDFYFVMCDFLLYDKHSIENKYYKEMVLIQRLWKKCDNGVNYNFSLLFLHVAQYATRTEFTFVENTRKHRGTNLVRMTTNFSQELSLLRNEIWKALGILRLNDEYRKLVDKILSEIHFQGLDEKDFQMFLKSDFEALYTYVLRKDNLSFSDAKIIDRFRQVAEQIKSPVDDRYLLANENKEFRLYKVLSREHLLGRSIEEDETIRRTNILSEISSYSLRDYVSLFRICNYLQENVDERDQWSISRGLDIVFELLENNVDFYVGVFEEYLNNNAPLNHYKYKQVTYLLQNIGYEKTYGILKERIYNNKEEWLACVWECLPEADINEGITEDYKRFVIANLGSDKPIVPSIRMMKRYGDRDDEIRRFIINILIEKPNLSSIFLDHGYREEELVSCMDVFNDCYDKLSKIYINAIGVNYQVDSDGELFIKIFEKRPDIWREYVDWIKNNDSYDYSEQTIFELIWNSDKWKECIDYAYYIFIETDRLFFVDQPARLMLSRTQKELDIVTCRKKQWLLDRLHSDLDIQKKNKLIEVVVNVAPDWKLEFILEYLRENRKIEDFKEIQLFPLSASWTGSEIPLINKKMDFLILLKESLKGIDYIEHRNYLDERIRRLEEYKSTVEKKEYIEESDYA